MAAVVDLCSVYARTRHFIFFFSSRRRHTRCIGDWSSDVCSSDLFTGFAVWLFWLRGDGEWDRGIDEFEGATLGGGGFGGFVDFDVVVVVAVSVVGGGVYFVDFDVEVLVAYSVAGEGGQMIE